MDRETFTSEFLTRVRHVLQWHERETVARAEKQSAAQAHSAMPSAFLRSRSMQAAQQLESANTNLDAALIELADFTFDAIEQAQHQQSHTHSLPSSSEHSTTGAPLTVGGDVEGPSVLQPLSSDA